MAVDYAGLAQVAKTLIEENGRTATLIRLDKVPLSASQPWRGTDFADAQSIQVTAVFVGYANDDVDGDLIRRGDQRAFVAQSSLPAGANLREFDLLRDDANLEWKIVAVEIVQPGAPTLLYKLQLRK